MIFPQKNKNYIGGDPGRDNIGRLWLWRSIPTSAPTPAPSKKVRRLRLRLRLRLRAKRTGSGGSGSGSDVAKKPELEIILGSLPKKFEC